MGEKLVGERTELAYGNAGYPEALMTVPSPPERLYVVGSVDALVPGLAVIGARRATPYGLGCARRFARIAAQKGVVFGIPENIESFAAVVRKLSEEYHYPYLDLYSATRNLPDKAKLFNPGDGIHLTPAGHEFVALKELEFLADSKAIK